MKVPKTHYIYFWFTNSVMASGTGIVMGYLFSPFIMLSLKIPDDAHSEVIFFISLIFFLGMQFVLFACFYGKRRGEFEYSFLEKRARDKKVNKRLSTELKQVKRELKIGGVISAHERLKAATKEFPENFVTRFLFALSCERMGSREAAIEAYETASMLVPGFAPALEKYVKEQISRVTLRGPTNISSAPGLQYLMW